MFAQPWRESRHVVLLALIGLNVVTFVAQFFLDAFAPGFVRDYLALSSRGIHDAYAWQFVTATLLYGSPWHFLGNMLVLYILGRDLESILGQRHFLYLFLSGAIGGELGHFRLKAKHVAGAILLLSLVMLAIDRNGAVIHSAIPGGLAAGWLYANLLGFGHASWVRRLLHRRREAAERVQRMTPAEFIEREIDPLLEKISRKGIQSLTRAERRLLSQAREKVGQV